MPTICSFYGITIRMYFDEHPRPHFHAYSAGHDAAIEIETLEVIEGHLPRRAMSLVLEWASEHRAALRENWKIAEAHGELQRIEPLI